MMTRQGVMDNYPRLRRARGLTRVTTDTGHVPSRGAASKCEDEDYPFWSEAFYLHYVKSLPRTDVRCVYLGLVWGRGWDEPNTLKGTHAVPPCLIRLMFRAL